MRRVRPRTWIVLAVVAVAALVGGYTVVTWDSGTASATLREYPVGARPAAPAIGGELLDGGELALTDLRGDVVVLNVWASWCGPCRAETADLEQVHQATRDLGVSFVGLNIRDQRDRAVAFIRDRVTYPSIFDPQFATGLAFGDPPAPAGPPATLVIDRDGRVAAAIYRMVGKVELEQLVRRVAAEPRQAGPDRAAGVPAGQPGRGDGRRG